MAYVVDSSMALAWVMPDEASAGRGSLGLLRGDQGFVPAIWPLETANGVMVAHKRGRLDDAELADALTTLSSLPVVIDEVGGPLAWTRLFELAKATGLTVYDASYVELAMRLNLPLMTLDKAMSAAAVRLSVKVHG